MQDTQEEVKKDLLSIFNKKATRLPEWALLVEVARIAKYEPSYQNITFATWIYYAIKDLFQPVKNTWREIIDVNKKNRTVTAISYEMPKNGIAKQTEETTWAPDPALWNGLFKNKTLHFLNAGRKPYPVPKSTTYLIKRSNENDVENYLNSEKVNENLDKLFKPVIDTDIPVMTFEEVVTKIIHPLKKNTKKTLTFENWFFDKKDIEFVIDALKHFNVIDESENYIEPAHTQGQYLYGLIDGLVAEKKIKKGSLNTIYKCFCEKINRPYKEIKRPSQNEGSAYLNGKTEMMEYITSGLI